MINQLQNYMRWTEKTCASLDNQSVDWTKEPSGKSDNGKDDVMHMLLGMVTETGELADNFKTSLAYGKEIDWVNIEEELGDLMFYIASFCRITGIDLEDIILTNVAKLEERYKNGFSKEDATNRNLEKEREILEKS